MEQHKSTAKPNWLDEWEQVGHALREFHKLFDIGAPTAKKPQKLITCPHCDGNLVRRCRNDTGRAFWACSNCVVGTCRFTCGLKRFQRAYYVQRRGLSKEIVGWLLIGGRLVDQ